ncbi:MAG: accessory gene regulator protein AgrB [Candidatus Azotimanducaceae bacterium]|jgi:accessory gene regulator protein AgrB
MSETPDLPKWFWIVCGLALLWNLLGLGAFLAQIMMSADALAQLPQAEQDIYSSTPAWANIAFGCAVVGGVLGCLALLLKRAIAFPILIISLLGVVVQMSHAFLLSEAFEVYGPGSVVMPILVLLMAIALVWFSNNARSKSWIV